METIIKASTPDAAGASAVSWGRLLSNLADDQKRIWMFPSSVKRGKKWVGMLAVGGITAALIPLDRVEPPYFRHSTDFERFNATFSGRNTSMIIAGVPACFLVTGLFRRDSYARSTALLAGEAVVDAEILTSAMKNVGHRLRPAAMPINQPDGGTWFRDKGVTLGGAGSFPSGHTIAAFSVATVFSQRYRNHRWVPYVSYGLAGIIGFSRISLLSHFSSDVFVGAALGYSISRFVVLP